MSYPWGFVTKPVATFDRQIYVDAAHNVWEWDGAIAAWTRRQGLVAREVDTQLAFPAGTSMGGNPLYRTAARMANTWDTSYSRAFVEATDASSQAQVFGRIAQVSLADLFAWLPTAVPNDGSVYTNSVRLRVFEVFDASLKSYRTYGFNALYGGLRGRHCYRSGMRRGRLTPPKPACAGIDAAWSTHWGIPDLGTQLLQYFLGTAPSRDDDCVVWTTRRTRDLYLQPSNNRPSVIYLNSGAMGRMAWDPMDVWNPAPDGAWTFDDGTVAPNPAIVWVGNGVPTPRVDSPTSLKGLRQVGHRVQAMVAYLIKNETIKGRYAIYLKPLGITHFVLDTGLAASGFVPWLHWELVCENVFQGDARHVRRVVVPLDIPGPDQGDRHLTGDGWRFSVYDALDPRLRSASQLQTLSTGMLPRYLRFYMRHKQTGLRSEVLEGTIELVTRRNNAPLQFIERRGEK